MHAAYNWGEEPWAAEGRPLLNGKAPEAFPGLADNDCGDEQIMQAAVWRREEVAPETSRVIRQVSAGRG